MSKPPRSLVQSRGVCATPLVLLLVAASDQLWAQRPENQAAGLSTPQAQQTAVRALSLDRVIELAEARGEQIAIAQFGVARAVAGEQSTRSEKLPQLSAGASYDRTLKSEFSGPFSTDSSASGDGGFGADLS